MGDEVRDITKGKIIYGLVDHSKDFGFDFKFKKMRNTRGLTWSDLCYYTLAAVWLLYL